MTDHTPTPEPADTRCVHLRDGGCCQGPGYCSHGCRDAAQDPDAEAPATSHGQAGVRDPQISDLATRAADNDHRARQAEAATAYEQALHEDHRRAVSIALGGSPVDWPEAIRRVRKAIEDRDGQRAEVRRLRATHEEHRQRLAAALSEARGHGWDHLIGRAESVRAAATERADILEEARDALESAGQGGAHGDDWPAIAPAIRKLTAELDLARATANDYAAADSADAAAGSYAHRAEHAEAERDRLAAELADMGRARDAAVARANRNGAALAAAQAAADVCREDAETNATRAEEAEATLARVRRQVAEWGTWAGTEFAIRDMRLALGDTPAPQPEDPAALDGPMDPVRILGAEPRAALDGEQPTAEPEPKPREVCCGCGSPDITYRNYRDLPFCHRCAASTTVEYGGHGYHPPTAAPEPDDAELTAEEARDLADDLALQLYQAQDALEFVAEMCNIADRDNTPVTTTRVRDWLKGAQCARQAGLVLTHGPVADAVRRTPTR